ncbi:exonuclease subunit SbcC [Staphylococcus devriesei]|uniref:Nuclease SbcCD subunit C n=5 Tax=Staphylococcus devriesei TaxID=586733 RepID=A0ABX5I286_9STAP|nr:exonuclease subunit SbcC [Staphylococcus devriesei]PTF14432.1 SMC family ATPase [Staphylococcus devriesei]PTF17495.1 SMC family ATPase [Staphylococcus devriesei]SUM03654.1 exonuclease SbcC [Staphylococcus devriesei]
MKPLKLTLSNFGPFLNETIDFQHIKDEHLFLISGKTGSGKTMLFDAIVYALFGKASTEGRNEGDLRSHFADGKSPMSVTYEFKLNDKDFKIVRQGSFIKEGNSSQTAGKLDVFEFNPQNNQYELKESKISTGNNFIKNLLGINAEQFRQLFILPQGEFKKFLVSNSSDKQSILRTLFNSIRFEEMQTILLDEVKNEKKQIETRYNQIQSLWEDIETFENEKLIQLKQLNSMQTKEIIKSIPQFEKLGLQVNEKVEKLKSEQHSHLASLNVRIEDNKKLVQAQNELEYNKNQKEKIEEQKDKIDSLKKELKRLNEVKTLDNLYQQKNAKEQKLQETNSKIASTNNDISNIKKQLTSLEKEYEDLEESTKNIKSKEEYINKTKQFFDSLTKYSSAYKEVVEIGQQLISNKEKQDENDKEILKLQNKIKEIDIDDDKINQLSQSIFQLERELDRKVLVKNNRDKYNELNNQKHSTLKDMEELQCEVESLSEQLESVDKTSIDLNNKQTFVTEIQAALHIGDTCPICGNTIESLNEHIDFDKISKNQHAIKRLTNEINVNNNKIGKLETTAQLLSKQMDELEINKDEDLNIEALKKELDMKNEEIELLQQQSKKLDKLQKKLEDLKENKNNLLLQFERLSSQKQQHEILINDFENTTSFSKIKDFETCYITYDSEVDRYKTKIESVNKNIQQSNHNLAIETNNLNNYITASNDIDNEIKSFETNIDDEMNRIGLKSYEEVDGLLSKLSSKKEIEKEIDDYNHQHQKYSLEIDRLINLTKGKELEDISALEIERDEVEKLYNSYVDTSATVQFKIQKNREKFESIEEHITYLNNELKEQQQIFELAEVLSGKNSRKLTLENYVLIYYLERIIQQANIRLANMSGKRYQLQRSQTVSQGYSGLEINVFDFYSNKARHISSLSGGETFQASLALALGLSEVVQQESGGITLESMFIDEGFGTLDQETLETALDTLLKLKTTGRMVGIISHVSELKQRIPLILEVKTNQYQSYTQFKRN